MAPDTVQPNPVIARWRTLTNGNGAEVTMIAIAVLGTIWAIVATIVAGQSAQYRRDLAFTGVLSQTRTLIQGERASGFANYQSTALSFGDASYPVDTLAVTGDSMALGSLATGGFLRDQFDRFNDYVIRRSVLHAVDTTLSAELGETPSIFRIVRTDTGARVLSSVLNEFAMTVPSPLAEQQWIGVTTSDWHRGAAFLGGVADLEFATGANDLSAPSNINGLPCWVKNQGDKVRYLYCGSSAGSDVAKRYAMSLTLGAPRTFNSGAMIERSGEWLNNRRDLSSQQLRAGALLYNAAWGPMAISNMESGVLADVQWINGKLRFTTSREGTLQFFSRAGRSTTTANRAPLHLTFDGVVTAQLEDSVAAFMARTSGEIESMSIVVSDLSNGEVRTIVESGARSGAPLRAFEPLLMGSTVKPLLAAAILSEDPGLATLTVNSAGAVVSEVAGVPLRKPFRSDANGCNLTVITFNQFLTCSNNQYAAELLIRSLQHSARGQTFASGRVPKGVLEHASLTNGLLALFEDVDVVMKRGDQRSDRIWRGNGDATTADGVPRERGLHPWISEPWYIEADSSATPVDWLARYAFGGWLNRWTLVGMNEAYARIATDRAIALRIRQPALGAIGTAAVPPMSPRAHIAFERVREGLRLVGSEGTARGLNDVLQAVGSKTARMIVYAKTGTLDEGATQSQDDGIYIKSLAIALGLASNGAAGLTGGAKAVPQKVAEGDAPALTCGLSVTLRLQFRQDWRDRLHKAKDASLPPRHTEFAKGPLVPVLKRIWDRANVCGAVPSSASVPRSAGVPPK